MHAACRSNLTPTDCTVNTFTGSLNYSTRLHSFVKVLRPRQFWNLHGKSRATYHHAPYTQTTRLLECTHALSRSESASRMQRTPGTPEEEADEEDKEEEGHLCHNNKILTNAVAATRRLENTVRPPPFTAPRTEIPRQCQLRKGASEQFLIGSVITYSSSRISLSCCSTMAWRCELHLSLVSAHHPLIAATTTENQNTQY